MSTRQFKSERGISNLIATLILIAVAVVGGAFAYTAFRNQAQSTTGGKHIQVQSLDLTIVPSGSLFSITVKNSGTEPLENVEARLIASSGSWTVGSPPSFADVKDSSLTENVSGAHDITLATGDWDISTASFTQSISMQDTIPTGLFWKPDGMKLYEVGSDGEKIYEYDVSTPWDVSTASFSQSMSTQDDSPTGLFWKPDGTKLYEIGNGGAKIYEYDVPTAWDVSTASFTQSMATQDTYPNGLFWKSDGTKLYEVERCESGVRGGGHGKIYEYGISTAWDVSTASLSQSMSTQDDRPVGLFWKPDGTKLYEVGSQDDKIYEHDVSTAWDVSTASFSQGISTQDASPTGLFWKPDGTKLYEIGNGGAKIYEYDVGGGTSPSGTWTSIWKDFGEVKKFTSLSADASTPGASDVEVRVEVSDDGSTVKDSTGFTSVKNSPTLGLEGLDKGRYARLSVKLERGSTPTVDSVSLNYQGQTTLLLGSASPNETVSGSRQVSVDLHEGVEYVVRIVGYDDEGNEVLSKTIKVLSG